MATKKSNKFLNNNQNLPMDIVIDYTVEQLEEIRKCREDVFYFAQNYFYIINLDQGRQKINLYEPQRDAIEKIINNRYTVICASRQVGKSTLMTVVCLWYAIFTADFHVAILANKEDIAKEILERIKLAYEELPNWLKAGVWEFTKENIRLANNSKITISTTSADAVRGKSINLLFMDEFAHVRKEIADDFFKSVMPTISSSKTAKIVVVSTPKGSSGKFYEIFSNAEKGKAAIKSTKGWVHQKIFWHQIPGRDDEWRQEQLELIGYDMTLWDQEYDLVFLDDGAAVLNAELLERLKSQCRPPDMSYDQGDYQIWDEPQQDHIYSFGVDVGEGVGQDFTVTQILDITDPTNIRQVGKFTSNRMQPYVFAEKLNQIARSWGRPYLCIESNKEGTSIIEALYNTHRYDNIVTYTMQSGEARYQKMGIYCHQNSKYTGIMNMKYFLEHLEAVHIKDITTIKEFETFTRKENKTWGAKKGFKDDHVMALIWALIILEKDIAERYLEVLEYDDAGKPIRIHDPNIDLANEIIRNGGEHNAYARLGNSPLPSYFMRGSAAGESTQDNEIKGFMGTGWKLA